MRRSGRLTQWRINAASVRLVRASRSAGSVLTMTALSWLMAWVRALMSGQGRACLPHADPVSTPPDYSCHPRHRRPRPRPRRGLDPCIRALRQCFPASPWSGPTPATRANSSTGRHPRHHPAHRPQTRRANQLRRPAPRWAVERTLSWINRCRRTVRDYERLPEHHAAMVQWAMIIIMIRRSPTTTTGQATHSSTHRPHETQIDQALSLSFNLLSV